MTLIEQESTNLRDHITYWDSVRQENLLAFYAKKEGYTHLGLQPLAALAVSEYRCKEAMKMKMLLISLSKSAYGDEPWTLSDVSAELINTSPKNCFKKNAFTVTVYFDNDDRNTFPYVCWEYIYYQDENSEWHKVAGEVDVNGLYFKEITGDISYFQLFQPDAEKYGHSGHWSVRYKNQILSTSVTSSSRAVAEPESRTERPPTHPISVPKTPRKRRRQTDEDTNRESPTSTSSGLRLRRRGIEQGESSTDGATTRRRRSRTRRISDGSAVSPEQVGSRTESVPREGLGRIERLQEEARDPPVILIQGCANNLKCFRNRNHHRHKHLYLAASTVFTWVYSNNDRTPQGRMLVSFTSNSQRDLFLRTVTIPKGCRYCFGTLDCL